jgi:hypothetical protein
MFSPDDLQRRRAFLKLGGVAIVGIALGILSLLGLSPS